jgi:hypothetical protein
MANTYPEEQSIPGSKAQRQTLQLERGWVCRGISGGGPSPGREFVIEAGESHCVFRLPNRCVKKNFKWEMRCRSNYGKTAINRDSLKP